MNLKRCENGHFYDVDKYQSCPHCQGGGAGAEADDDMTATVKFGGSGTQQGVTIPATEAYEGTGFGGSWNDAIPETVPASEAYTEPKRVKDLIHTIPTDNFPPHIQPEENESVTVRYYPNEMKTEPVVGWLVCVSGEDAGKDYMLKSGRNFIGRSSSMDVILSGDKSVSREKHAILLYEPKRREFLAQAGDSRELFYLNDEVVLSTVKLKAYDKLLIGNTELLFIPFCGENFSWDDLEEKE